jgi:hypothetical protein
MPIEVHLRSESAADGALTTRLDSIAASLSVTGTKSRTRVDISTHRGRRMGDEPPNVKGAEMMFSRLAMSARPLVLSLVLLALPSLVNAEVRMTRIDPATQQVTLRNVSGGALDITSWQMCSGPGTYATVSSLSPSGPTLLVDGGEVTVTYAFFNNAADELAIYVSGPFTGEDGAANIRDYMQFNTINGTRESVAVAAGIWGVDDMVSGTGPFVYTGDGTQNGVTFWEQESAPSVPGLPVWGGVVLALSLARVGLHRIRERE